MAAFVVAVACVLEAELGVLLLVAVVFNVVVVVVVVFLAVGWVMTFWAPGVGVMVQYQSPLASAQAWPSLAVP